MSEHAAIEDSAVYADATSRVQTRDNFFLYMTVALLAILLVGFAPSLYLRFVFDEPPIPFYLHVHGTVVTCWFLWLVCQATLVAVRRTDLHRRIGLFGVVLGVAVAVAGPMATLGFIPRLIARGVDIEPPIVLFSWIVFTNFISIVMFLGFLSSGLLLRAQPDIHKRLMLFASMSIMAPPLARIWRWPVFEGIGEIPFVTTAVLLLLVPLVIHDLVKGGRLHGATRVGGSLFVLGVLAPLAIANTDFAQGFVRGMG